eukprot:3313034-Rhodomonas_salina.1
MVCTDEVCTVCADLDGVVLGELDELGARFLGGVRVVHRHRLACKRRKHTHTHTHTQKDSAPNTAERKKGHRGDVTGGQRRSAHLGAAKSE